MPKKETRSAEATPRGNSTRVRKPSQEDIVLHHMKEYGSITSMQAFEKYSITRLAAVIFNLRQEGWDIAMIREVSRSGKRYGRYYIKERRTA